jgi:formylglycine-generating enzyme required for sulfatase activity
MAGNVDEWTDDPTGSMTAEPYRSAFMGGHMLGRIRGRCRPKTSAHDPLFYSWVQGFRCCKNAE